MSDSAQPTAGPDEKGFDLIDLVTPVCSKAALEILGAVAPQAKRGLSVAIGDIFGGLIGDRIHYWRRRNLVDLLEVTAKHIREKGVDLANARVLPEGELYAIFNGASKADQPDVQRMWASLLASSLDPNGDHSETRKFAATLEQLNGSEARMLAFLAYADGWEREFRMFRKLRNPILDSDGTREVESRLEAHLELLKLKFSDTCGDQSKDNLRSIANLQRLGCASRNFEVANAADVLESIEIMEVSRPRNDLYMVKAADFERLIDDILVHIAVASGQHGTYEDKGLIDIGSSYRPVVYALTDYGSNLVRVCGARIVGVET